MKCLTDTEISDLVRNAHAEQLARAARNLIATAERYGLVLTIEQVPRLPLAMGHYGSVASVREARVNS